MVEFRLLGNPKESATVVPRRLPCVIGRNRDADVCLDAVGVWERHVVIDLQPPHGFSIRARPEAPVPVNGEPIVEGVLRNGDVLGIGSLQIQFWLSETRQRGVRIRESLTWVLLGALCAIELGLIYAVLP
jgi:pSer/pThr/pTyr-binding forkhead associated (FHA) protein